MKTKLLVLGAGCSCDYGYPLAVNMKSELDQFAAQIESSASRIANIVRKTAALFHEFDKVAIPPKTLDELVRMVSQRAQNAPPQQMADEEAFRRIERAKAAVSAMFRSNEEAAIKTGLAGYKKWFQSEFGNRSCLDIMNTTEWRVLTFNYDLLFELAFKDYFQIPSHADYIYSPTFLNSGLLLSTQSIASIVLDRFSFLKLHGSAGIGCSQFGGWRFQLPVPDANMPYKLDDQEFFPEEPNAEPYRRLIIFPHEKEYLDAERYNVKSLAFHEYLPNVWNAAKQLAGQAEEIHIVGYSVNNPDWQDFQLLLNAATHCKRIVVQDPYRARAICGFLRTKLPSNIEIIPHEEKF